VGPKERERVWIFKLWFLFGAQMHVVPMIVPNKYHFLDTTIRDDLINEMTKYLNRRNYPFSSVLKNYY
jgi:hypothetical protein